jgi:hypothetical protein
MSIKDAYTTMRMNINSYFGSDVVKDLNWNNVIKLINSIENGER